MALPKHITERRSIFPQFFTEEPVGDDVILQLMEAANLAPTHRKTEPWRFRVYRGAARKQLLAEMRSAYESRNGAGEWNDKLEQKFSKKINQSPVVLVIFMARDPEESVPEWEEIAAVSCAVQNIWTSLSAYRLGGYWSSPGFVCGYGAFPGAPDRHRCLGMFYLGHHEAPDLPRRVGDVTEKVTFV